MPQMNLRKHLHKQRGEAVDRYTSWTVLLFSALAASYWHVNQ